MHALLRGAVIAGGVLNGVLFAASSPERPWLAWLGFACGGLALGVVPQLVRMRTGAFCGFCGAGRAAVAWLVAGPHVSICDGCIGTSVGLVYLCPDGATVNSQLIRFLAGSAPRDDEPRAAAIIGAARALAKDALELRAVADAAMGVGHYTAALEALDAIPPGERELNDENYRAVAMGYLGRAAQALHLIDALEARPMEAVNRGLLLNNRTWFEFLLGEKDLPRLLAASERAIQTVAGAAPDVPDPFFKQSLAYCFGTLSCVLLAMGRHRDVVERLRTHEAGGGAFTTTAMFCLGEAHHALGDQEEASIWWRKVVAAALPRSDEAVKATQRLAG